MAAKKKKNKKKKMVKRVILGILAVLFIAGGIYAGPKEIGRASCRERV